MAYKSYRLPQNIRFKMRYTVVVVSRAEFNNSALFFYYARDLPIFNHFMLSNIKSKHVAPAKEGR